MLLNQVKVLAKFCEKYDDLGGSPTLYLMLGTIMNHWRWPVKQDKEGIIYRLTCYM